MRLTESEMAFKGAKISKLTFFFCKIELTILVAAGNSNYTGSHALLLYGWL
jgi:hypothetical protein